MSTKPPPIPSISAKPTVKLFFPVDPKPSTKTGLAGHTTASNEQATPPAPAGDIGNSPPPDTNFPKPTPDPSPPEILQQLAFNPTKPKIHTNTPELPSNQDPDPLHTSPDDRLESALTEIRDSVAADLLATLSQTSPKYFETIVLDLLHKLGYGTSRNDLQRVGGPGDSGIDGVISLDKLGLEKVYVQAKRWQNTIGRPQVQEFYGALAGQKASKGVFITTSRFTPQAVDFANSVERIVLVDGDKLTQLMIDHEIGVTLRPLWIPKLDSDYFEE